MTSATRAFRSKGRPATSLLSTRRPSSTISARSSRRRWPSASGAGGRTSSAPTTARPIPSPRSAATCARARGRVRCIASRWRRHWRRDSSARSQRPRAGPGRRRPRPPGKPKSGRSTALMRRKSSTASPLPVAAPGSAGRRSAPARTPPPAIPPPSAGVPPRSAWTWRGAAISGSPRCWSRWATCSGRASWPVQQGIPFSQQRSIVGDLAARYRRCASPWIRPVMGEAVVEQLQEDLGRTTVEGVLMTGPRRLDTATALREAVEDRRLRIPPDGDLRRDLHAVRAEAGLTGAPRLMAERSGTDGHADRFWALALACAAARTAATAPIEGASAGPRAATLRDSLRGARRALCARGLPWHVFGNSHSRPNKTILVPIPRRSHLLIVGPTRCGAGSDRPASPAAWQGAKTRIAKRRGCKAWQTRSTAKKRNSAPGPAKRLKAATASPSMTWLGETTGRTIEAADHAFLLGGSGDDRLESNGVNDVIMGAAATTQSTPWDAPVSSAAAAATTSSSAPSGTTG